MIEVSYAMRRARSATPHPPSQTDVKWMGVTYDVAALRLIGEMKRVTT